VHSPRSSLRHSQASEKASTTPVVKALRPRTPGPRTEIEPSIPSRRVVPGASLGGLAKLTFPQSEKATIGTSLRGVARDIWQSSRLDAASCVLGSVLQPALTATVFFCWGMIYQTCVAGSPLSVPALWLLGSFTASILSNLSEDIQTRAAIRHQLHLSDRLDRKFYNASSRLTIDQMEDPNIAAVLEVAQDNRNSFENFAKWLMDLPGNLSSFGIAAVALSTQHPMLAGLIVLGCIPGVLLSRKYGAALHHYEEETARTRLLRDMETAKLSDPATLVELKAEPDRLHETLARIEEVNHDLTSRRKQLEQRFIRSTFLSSTFFSAIEYTSYATIFYSLHTQSIGIAAAMFLATLAYEFGNQANQFLNDLGERTADFIGVRSLQQIISIGEKPRERNAIAFPDDTTIAIRDLLIQRGGELLCTIPEIDIPPGSLVLIRGDNGAGKSTFLHVLLGQRSIQGKYQIGGIPVDRLSDIGFTERVHYEPAQTGSMEGRTPEEIISANVSGNPLHGIARMAGGSLARNIAKHIGLSVFPSTGQYRLLQFARLENNLRAPGPHIIVLDEPMAGLGKKAKVALAGLIAGRGKNTVILVEHQALPEGLVPDLVLTFEDGTVRCERKFHVVE
jgi:ABC-type transport system involved in cytochrome bd biosynthesis fused ATPase/permease subunit